MTPDGDRPVPLSYAVETERFVQLVVAGGLAMMVGLWMAKLTVMWSIPWLVGVMAALVGTIVSLAGIYRELSL